MKHLLLIILFLTLLSCTSKEDDPIPTHSVEVRISYYYNAFQGYKPDTGADIYLFKEGNYNADLIDYRIGLLTVKETGEKVNHLYKAEADAAGVARIDQVPEGKYLLVAASKGRFSYSKKVIEVKEHVSLVKNFGYLSEFSDNGEAW